MTSVATLRLFRIAEARVRLLRYELSTVVHSDERKREHLRQLLREAEISLKDRQDKLDWERRA
jgi:hypothetical protein